MPEIKCDKSFRRYTEIKKTWNKYKASLMKRHPVKKGQKWEFYCPHFAKLDYLINGENKR